MSIATRISAFGAAGQWIIGLTALLLLSGASLLASIGGNVWLVRKVWIGKAECRAGMEEAARIAIENEQRRAVTAEEEARLIATKARTDTTRGVTEAQRNTHARETQLGNVPVVGTCRMPDSGMPSIQPAIDEANAAAGD